MLNQRIIINNKVNKFATITKITLTKKRILIQMKLRMKRLVYLTLKKRRQAESSDRELYYYYKVYAQSAYLLEK